MKQDHPDFARISNERSIKVEWSQRLFQLANQERLIKSQSSSATSIDVDVPFHVFDELNRDHFCTTPSPSHQCTLRSLYPPEIAVLESICRCKCNDWSAVLVLQRLQDEEEVLDLSELLPTYITDTSFDGTVVLIHATSATRSAEEAEKSDTMMDRMVPAGIHGCTVVSNSMIHFMTAKVHRCNVISETYIDSYSTVMNCTYIAMSSLDDATKETVNGISPVDTLCVSVGAESGGGRSLRLHPESTMIDISQQLGGSRSHEAILAQRSTVESRFNVIGSFCIMRDTPSIYAVHLHPKSSIIAATFVEQALLFPGSKISNSSTARNVVLQWDCSITDHSFVSDVFFMEQAVAGPQSTVTNTVLGPDVHISCGEVHASVLGPNTNAHHQSLVIATLWLCGRGNVGYGSNVGSNHTGRIPDQECCAGEGIFWGLSCAIKFPVDLTCSPYSIVAAGTTMAPQRCTMPFSLITNSNTGIGTEIVPGWVLRYSPYTVVRSEQKFAQRRKAQRHMNYTGWKIIRPDIVHQCYMAREQLWNVATTTNDEMAYSVNDVPGVGANQMTEKGRRIGVDAYSELIQQFALQGLYLCLVEMMSREMFDTSQLLELLTAEFLCSGASMQTDFDDLTTVEWTSFPWDDSDTSSLWQSQRFLLLREFPLPDNENILEWIKNLLGTHIALETAFSERVRQCKQRDDRRGAVTIPGYEETHVLVDKDAVVISVQTELEMRKQDVDRLLQKLNVIASS